MSDVYWVELLCVQFSGRGEGGVGFSRLVDWYGVPDARGGVDPVPGAHGSFARASVARESLVISLEGGIGAGSRSELESLRFSISNALVGSGLMRVADSTGVWGRFVEVQRASFEDVGSAARSMRVVVDVVAPDPVRYREWLTAGPVGLPSRDGGLVLPSAFPWDFGREVRAIAQVDNTGAVPIFPIVTVSGAADALVVHGGPRRVEFGPFDGELVIDNEARRAFLNGTDVTRQLVRRDWHEAPVGVVTDFWFDATDAIPGTALTVAYRIGAW